jgi:hypothetical protein
MKKITMLTIAVLVSAMCFAQAQRIQSISTGTKLNAGEKQQPSVQQNDKTPVFKVINLSERIGEVANDACLSNESLRANGDNGDRNDGKSTNSNSSKIRKTVIKTPSGTPKSYALTTFVTDGQSIKGFIGGYADTVYVDGKDVYFKNLVFLIRDGSYVKGQITAGDEHNGTITIANGQQCADGYYAWMASVDKDNNLVVDQDTPNFTFSIRNDTIVSDPVKATKDLYLLAVNTDDQIICLNASYYYEPVDASKLIVATLPNGLKLDDYKAISSNYRTLMKGKKEIVRIGKSGNDFYLTNLSSAPGAVVKGTLNADGKVEVKLPFYLGIADNKYQYIKAATLNPTIDEKGDSVLMFKITDKDKIVCDYDAATGKIKSNDFLMVTVGPSFLGYLNTPLFEPFDDVATVVPATAVNTTYALSWQHKPNNEDSRESVRAIVARDGNDFYFKNISSLDPNAAFKGTLKGDSIYVMVPQFIGHFDDTHYVYLNRIGVEPTYGLLYAEKENTQTIRLYFDKTTNTITSNENFGSANIDGVIDMGLCSPHWVKFDGVAATVPADATIEKYVLSTSYLDSETTIKAISRIAHKDNTYYFMDIDPKDSLAVFVGKREGNKITVDLPQFVGGANLNYLRVAYKPFKVMGEEGDSVWAFKLTDDKQLVFNYDADNDVISSDSLVMLVTFDGSSYNYFYKPSYTKYAPYAAIPATPFPLSWDDYTSFFGKYVLNVYIPSETDKGEFIDPADMTYSIYMDNSTTPYVFDAARYGADFKQDTDEVPNAFTGPDFLISHFVHIIYMLDSPKEKVGIASHYTFNGVKKSSEIAYYFLDPTGINNNTATNVKSDIYYDMTGRRVMNPSHGLFIHKVVFSDGSSRTYKEVIK